MKIVKYFILILTILLNLINPCFSETKSPNVCYYLSDSGGWDLPFDNCKQYEKLMKNISAGTTDIKPIEEFSFDDANTYSSVYLSGYGLPDGFFTKNSVEQNDSSRISWKDIATKIHVPLLLIDACFSGYVFDYDYKSATVITSAYKTPSWNVILDNGDNVSSFIVMLRCIFDTDYECPIDSSQCGKYNIFFKKYFIDMEECQFSLIVNKTIKNHYDYFTFPTDPVVGITTVYINGKPWRKLYPK